MNSYFDGLSPEHLSDEEHRLQNIIDFWNLLEIEESSGGTTWGVLESLKSRVTESLAKRPRDLRIAESLTALAASLIAGDETF